MIWWKCKHLKGARKMSLQNQEKWSCFTENDDWKFYLEYSHEFEDLKWRAHKTTEKWTITFLKLSKRRWKISSIKFANFCKTAKVHFQWTYFIVLYWSLQINWVFASLRTVLRQVFLTKLLCTETCWVLIYIYLVEKDCFMRFHLRSELLKHSTVFSI